MYLLHPVRWTCSPLLRQGRGCLVAGRRLSVAGLLACVALLALGLACVSTAVAADGPQTVTFQCHGFPQQFNVPPGVTQIDVSAQGAAGGGDNGGLGGLATGPMRVSPPARVTVVGAGRGGG